MASKDIFKIVDPDLQTLVGDYNDLHKVWKLLMSEGVVNSKGLVEVDKFAKGFDKLEEHLTEEQGKSIAEAINTFVEAE